jgi:hypothetical protein
MVQVSKLIDLTLEIWVPELKMVDGIFEINSMRFEKHRWKSKINSYQFSDEILRIECIESTQCSMMPILALFVYN